MRVTFVSYDDTPPLGGQGVMLEGMRSELQRRGVDVTTISGRGEHAIAFPRVTGRAPLDLSLHLNRHPELMLRDAPDVIHAHGGPGGVLLLRRVRAPLVYTAHHTYRQAHPRRSPRRALGPLEARAYRRAARVLAVSPSTAEALRGMHVPRVEVLGPGVEMPVIEPSMRSRGHLLFVGRLEAEKGALVAVTGVMLPLLAQRPDWTATVIGEGSLAPRVAEAAASQPRLEVLGRVDDTRLHAEYARASVVLMPSRYEGLGLVALEAQSHGTPVVGFDVTGLRDAVRGGILVTAGDAAALREATLRLVDDASTWSEYSRRGRTFVAHEHSWDVIGRRLMEIYHVLLRLGEPS